MRRVFTSAARLRVNQSRMCSDTADEKEESLFDAPFDRSALPSVLLVTGDAFVEDNFSHLSLDPKWLQQDVMRHAEDYYHKRGTFSHENLGAWKPLSATVHYLSNAFNLEMKGWSRDPNNTSRMIYTLLARDTQERSSTNYPCYHVNQLKNEWSDPNRIPLYNADQQGHSATYRYSPDFCEVSAQGPVAKNILEPESNLPEMFALIGSTEDGWESLRSSPPSVLQSSIDAAKSNVSESLRDASPLTVLLNYLVGVNGCVIQKQTVTNHDLRRITFLIENPSALNGKPLRSERDLAV